MQPQIIGLIVFDPSQRDTETVLAVADRVIGD